MKISRNDACWCGSGKKYKKCHEAFDDKVTTLMLKGELVPDPEIVLTPAQIEGLRKSAAINNAVLDLVAEKIHEGMTTDEINTLVHDYTLAQGATPAPLNYGGFPKSVCTSINEVVCHGIPNPNRVLKSGDIINVDVSTIKDGYFSDASRMFLIGEVSEEAKKLVEVAKECLEKGLAAVKPWGHVGDIGAAVQSHAEAHGYSVVTEFGGHGIGLNFHEEPFVSHVGTQGEGMLLVPGMVFTIEPMINQGEYAIEVDEADGWTATTKDKKLSAQWEYMVLVTEDGYELLAW